MPYCPNCGAPVKAGEKYCFGCGTKMVTATEDRDFDSQPREPYDEQNSGDGRETESFERNDQNTSDYGTDERIDENSNEEVSKYPQEYPPTNRLRQNDNPDGYGRPDETVMNRVQTPPQGSAAPLQPYQQTPVQQPQAQPQVPVQQPPVQPQAPVKHKSGILTILARLLEIIFYLGLIIAVGVGVYLLYNFSNTISLNTLTP